MSYSFSFGNKITQLFFILCIFVLPSAVFAQNNPFGGMVVMANQFECDCSLHTKVYINPAKTDLPKEMLYMPPVTITYPFGQVLPGRYVLGTWKTYAVCMKWVGIFCVPRGVYPLMYMVGTSGGSTGGTPTPTPSPTPTTPPAETEPTTPTTPSSPNCSEDNIGGWNFNSGIRRQVGDASPSLKKLLYCMCNKLAVKGIKGRITSISDGNHIGELNECRDSATYNQCGSGSSCCYHSRTSCHYGGDNADNKSYAADIGMEHVTEIKSAAQSCMAGNYINEGDHIHVATFDCRD